MDENPLVGEPGSFKLSKARESGLPPSSQLPTTSHQPFKAAAKKVMPPLDLKTDVPTGMEPGRKGSASAKSPVTPGMKRKKERRKSRVGGGEEVGTPKTEGGG